MPVKRNIPYTSGMFFITFTCHKWLPLLAKVNGYDIIYKWFDLLKDNGHSVNGYVVMPNHVHALISFINTKQSINTIIGNGKRFMAYEIIQRLQAQNETAVLLTLQSNVEATRKNNNKQHEVWKLFFDWKDCRSNDLFGRSLTTCTITPVLVNGNFQRIH